MSKLAVIFGGAGFIGGNICSVLSGAGWRIRCVDGFLERTSADPAAVDGVPGVELIRCDVDETPEKVAEQIAGADLVVDAMGWTKHLDAIKDPAYDLRLNVASHLPVIAALRVAASPPALVVYLGSRHQYGRPAAERIDEDTPLTPVDVQGVHKTAAEHHWRLFAQSDNRFPVLALRFGNTFGPGAPIGDGDIGLISGFFRAALTDGAIRVFGSERRRHIVYARDLAETIARLAVTSVPPGFTPLNLSGRDVRIRDLASAVIAACGRGALIEEEMPTHIARIDIGEATLDDARLRSLIGTVPLEDLAVAMRATARNLRARLRRSDGHTFPGGVWSLGML